MRTLKLDIPAIGKSLVETASRELSVPGIVEMLFPYIYVASGRMSTRAISNWLLETQKIKISHTTVAKALREDDYHFRQISGSVAYYSERIATAGFGTDWHILFDEKFFECQVISNLPFSTETVLPQEIDAAVAELELWFTYPEEFRNACKPYLFKRDEDEDND